MKVNFQPDEWKIIETGFNPELNQISESIFSLGNGRMGQRANFEETYTGKSLQGNYIAGIYYPDKTLVGWWKNGYPEYFAKVLNAANWMGLEILIGDEILDLHHCKVLNFNRTLNMLEGNLERSFEAELPSGKKLKVTSKRLYSLVDDEAATFKYSITALNFSSAIKITSFTDGDIKNQDANYKEKFWQEVEKEQHNNESYLTISTKKTFFEVCTGTFTLLNLNNKEIALQSVLIDKEKYVSTSATLSINEGDTLDIYKYAVNISSENHSKSKLLSVAKSNLNSIVKKGFATMLNEQATAWKNIWNNSDIIIEGDVKAQQAIRFNIFQLNQTYTGKDARLNIGPKGFTGEKYGGSTYWDTEAYCVPFYLSTASPQVTKNLLLYRYNQLNKAIENAAKLGFNNGAALFPMVTINGEECHNEWEITFEEIHRNGAIAYAIFNYVRYTNDMDYLIDYGLEVLIAIARFWKQRVNWSIDKVAFVMLGVTGPNEYENNINNNWYTNTLAVWCLRYTIDVVELVSKRDEEKYKALCKKISFEQDCEISEWKEIVKKMYYPQSERFDVFLQQDGYLDKEQTLVNELDKAHLPLNQHWSWDRILRSCFIKQADVLQGFYFFEDDFDIETLRRNFDFYEPRTVHESSLSPCIHSILASRLGDEARAYQFYLRTARLDLDNYNNDTEDGLHITSMAGTWMSIVEGFAGMRVKNGQLIFNPFLPAHWQSFTFNILYRAHSLKVKISDSLISIFNHSENNLRIQIVNNFYVIEPNSEAQFQIESKKALIYDENVGKPIN